jgi:uncharacterized protein (DUF983 family)
MNECQLMLATTVDWECPECGHANIDSYATTVRPLCGGCDQDFDWGELIDPPEIAYFNRVLFDYSLEIIP